MNTVHNVEDVLQGHVLGIHHLADNVRTGLKCNRRLVLTKADQDCPSCPKFGLFSAKNRMCLGPRAGTELEFLGGPGVGLETELAAQAMRVDLYNTIDLSHRHGARSLRGNNDCKAAIDKWGLVNYVTKAMN